MSLRLIDLIDAAQALMAAGKHAAAIGMYEDWIAANPADPLVHAAWFNLGCLYTDLGQPAQTVHAMQQALQRSPNFPQATINLGTALERVGEPGMAVEAWQGLGKQLEAVTGQAIDFKLLAIKQIARVLIDQRQPAAAEAWLRQGLDIRADQRDILEQFIALRMAQCKWPIIEAWERVSAAVLRSGISPLSMTALVDDPLLHLATAKHYVEVAIDERDDAPDADRRDAAIDLSHRRLRVGYVSSDLREHAIGYLMAELFTLHDRQSIEVFAYYCGDGPIGETHARIRAAIEHWVDITRLDDASAARRIATDQIDILIDVNGLTRSARTGLFARRPAPIQVNWLGFPGSMGSPYHHYILADDWIIPPEAEIFYSEQVLRLPCYQPTDRKRAIAEPPTRAAVGLPEDAFVFCCFNGAQKFTPSVFARWLTILSRVPGSVLWLLDDHPDTVARLRGYASAAGVAAERLVFAPKLANASHLARYPLADLFLDTFPYGAHTTASDALWLGVPVLTLSGRSFASRVCGSLVRAAGLPELVVHTGSDYVERAVNLATHAEMLAALRARLQSGRETCVLFDMDGLVKKLEALFHEMVARHGRGATPQPDLSNLNVYRQIGLARFAAGDAEVSDTAFRDDYISGLRQRHRMRPLRGHQRLWLELTLA